MTDVTTYTRRENARRAGVEAGVPRERIKITVHKSDGEVRFGWKEVDPGSGDTGRVQRRRAAPATPTAAATESAAVAAPAAEQYECPLCGGDPSSQTWANEGVSCFCHECSRTWSVRTRKEIRTGYKIEKDREERNGVKRPSAGGACAAVWDHLDANPMTTAKELREVAAAKGWNVNNAICELYAWRKFVGSTPASRNRSGS